MFFNAKVGTAIVVLSVYLMKEVSPLVYREISNFNVSCYPSDSCHGQHFQQSEEGGDLRTCECDDTCNRRGTCCIDSPYVDPRPSARTEICEGSRIVGVAHYYYFNHTGDYSFFQVTKCHRWWNGPVQVKESCEMKDPVDGTDLMVAIPVTNIYSGISYKNYFCALCNDDIDGSVLWDVGIYEEGYKSLISDRFNVQDSNEMIEYDTASDESTCDVRNTLALVFNTEARFYGYWDNCSYETPRFVPLEVTLAIPRDIERYIKGCRSRLVSECPSSYRNIGVRMKCAAYLGIIKGPRIAENGWFSQRYYRNVHCAICNNVTNFEEFSCEPLSIGAIITTPTYPTSLTILFGHLLSDQGCLGENQRYVRGLGCRAVVCASPRHKVKNGRCTPE